MSFRIEKKYLIQPNQILEVNNWLSKNNFSKLYSGRQIESIYLENYQNDMFLNSEEGCVPRKKIRLRAYPQNQKKIKKFLLEIKTTSVEGRFKSTKKINERQSLKILNIRTILLKKFLTVLLVEQCQYTGVHHQYQSFSMIRELFNFMTEVS